MGTYRRINVASGRPLEKLAHYSRALRAGDMVLQSGTTAIDRAGNVRGEGDVAAQVEAIMALTEWSMDKAGGKLEDVVRSRIYLTDISLTDPAARTLAKYFRDVRPTSTLVQVSRLARISHHRTHKVASQVNRKDRGRKLPQPRSIVPSADTLCP
jgi:enamine deaminase RidA (YjgF/YER057c/UK114 family)